MICKYIMFESGPITFPCAVEHNIFASLKHKMKSAGLVECTAGPDGKITYRCYGESKGLQLKSNPEADSAFMDVFFNPTVCLAPPLRKKKCFLLLHFNFKEIKQMKHKLPKDFEDLTEDLQGYHSFLSSFNKKRRKPTLLEAFEAGYSLGYSSGENPEN